MALTIKEESKTKIAIEFLDEEHTLVNTIKEELRKNKDVKYAGYTQDHPIYSNPVLIIEVNAGTARECVEKAIKSLKKEFSEMSKAVAVLK